ncbi:MAG TPA: hypothetical protein VME44_17120, partial [Streptosporangiaceae bacterium]|nr:hypothetical protein [Streptosporangiaceae bacterium]
MGIWLGGGDDSVSERQTRRAPAALPHANAVPPHHAVPPQRAAPLEHAAPPELAVPADPSAAHPREDTALAQDAALPRNTALAQDAALPRNTALAQDAALPQDAAPPQDTAPSCEPVSLFDEDAALPLAGALGVPLDLLEGQLAEEEPWELSPSEIAELPRLGEEPPPEADEVPWWLSEEFTGSDEELEAAFIRSLPADIRAEYAAGPWTGAGEAWGAGFLHHDELAGPRPDGFAAGGEHDILAPGPELAAAAAAAAGRSAELGESELIGVLCGWQRLASWAQAGQVMCLNELVGRRKEQSVALKRPSLASHVDDEVAAALALTGQAAGRLLGVAVALGRLPAVAGALAAGRIDWVKAGLFADYL